MNELEKTEQTEKEKNEHDLTVDPVEQTGIESRPSEGGLRERVRKLLNTTGQQRGARTKQELAKDRTRAFAVLIGGTVAAVLVFMGMLSTPTEPLIRETGSRAAPNLGRPSTTKETLAPRSSATPLLDADVRSDEGNSDQLSPADIRGTSQRPSTSDEIGAPSETTRNDIHSSRVPGPQTKLQRGSSFSSAGSDPLAAYRLSNSMGSPRYSYGGWPVSNADTEVPISPGDDGIVSNETRPDSRSSARSSIVYVRTPEMTGGTMPTRSAATAIPDATALLPPGTRLVARLEAAATTAVKTPVVASIEYNYERGGLIIVPAGTTAVGDVQQASPEGFLSVRFHTLRMPDGRQEEIEGTAIALDHKPLKGSVSGKNTGKKLLSRTLSGVGTIAAYVVGAGGAGLNRTLTGESLLRDRLAGNIALAGEQELANAAYSQNITVTVPANTRFYVVLQTAPKPTVPSRIAEPAAPPVEIPTVQELRELMDLRREINRMYQDSNSTSTGGSKR